MKENLGSHSGISQEPPLLINIPFVKGSIYRALVYEVKTFILLCVLAASCVAADPSPLGQVTVVGQALNGCDAGANTPREVIVQVPMHTGWYHAWITEVGCQIDKQVIVSKDGRTEERIVTAKVIAKDGAAITRDGGLPAGSQVQLVFAVGQYAQN